MAKKRKRKYSRAAGTEVKREMHRYKRGKAKCGSRQALSRLWLQAAPAGAETRSHVSVLNRICNWK
jgi:hypothetical protein